MLQAASVPHSSPSAGYHQPLQLPQGAPVIAQRVARQRLPVAGGPHSKRASSGLPPPTPGWLSAKPLEGQGRAPAAGTPPATAAAIPAPQPATEPALTKHRRWRGSRHGASPGRRRRTPKPLGPPSSVPSSRTTRQGLQVGVGNRGGHQGVPRNRSRWPASPRLPLAAIGWLPRSAAPPCQA